VRERVVTCPGILLTGGSSRRMATDKSAIVWRGETFAARAARVLAQVCVPAVEVGAGVTALPSVREEPPGAGPLAALVAGARALAKPGPVVLLACDLPLVDVPLLQLLATWAGDRTVIPVAGGRAQYACARYGSDAVARAQAALAAGDHALRAAAGDDGDFDVLTEQAWRAVASPDSFADMDTPADLARLGLS
jgi:molybdopterin-guanine dinucleotide biosynthesis protein A